MNSILKNLLQVNVVVKDVEEAIKRYSDVYGIGPWGVWEFNPGTVEDMIIRDKKAEYSALVAVARIGGIEWEVIQAMDDKSVYAEFLKKHGEGIQHVGYKVENVEEAVKFFRSKGISVEQGGLWKGKYPYVYLSCEDTLKHMVPVQILVIRLK